jgi:energy-coupling factor transporter ATP-binding protein EcfA2
MPSVSRLPVILALSRNLASALLKSSRLALEKPFSRIVPNCRALKPERRTGILGTVSTRKQLSIEFGHGGRARWRNVLILQRRSQLVVSSFIRRFRLHRTTKESIVKCAVPDEHEGAITVLIGANNAGKTYTLESLRHALDTTRANKAERIAILEFTGPDKPRFIFLGNNSQHMGKVGQGIDPFVRPDKIGHPRDIPNYRPAAQALLFDMMEEHAPGLCERWASASLDERRKLLDAFPPVNPLFRCKQDHSVIVALQELLQGTLYFRRANAGGQILFEFLLTYDDAGPVPFGQWSDGQKMIFLVSMLLQHEATDVVLMDEIENHLHPERITKFLQLLRRARVQGIITTHHPHVLFSDQVDKAFFVEQVCKPLPNPPKELRREKPQDTVIPERHFTELRDDFDRIEHLYRLFDQHDQKLLRLSTQV